MKKLTWLERLFGYKLPPVPPEPERWLVAQTSQGIMMVKLEGEINQIFDQADGGASHGVFIGAIVSHEDMQKLKGMDSKYRLRLIATEKPMRYEIREIGKEGPPLTSGVASFSPPHPFVQPGVKPNEETVPPPVPHPGEPGGIGGLRNL